jgi:butyryl-CoA dehydrogenase
LKVLSGEEKERAHLLLEILTPVAKSYPSEMGVISVSQGLQCLGGYGYCDEFPLEQHFRDARIHPIHEGTTGIQALDLLGRKVKMLGGKAFDIYIQEAQKTMDEAAADEELKPFAEKLGDALNKVRHVTAYLVNLSSKEPPEKALADATLYLEFFGIVAIAWQWLVQAIAVKKGLEKNPSKADEDFYQGKHYACRFFYAYELPKIEGLAHRLTHPDGLTVEMDEAYFSD